jgi:hypothetical protein
VTIAVMSAVALLVIALAVYLIGRWLRPKPPIDIARDKYLDMLGENVGAGSA